MRTIHLFPHDKGKCPFCCEEIKDQCIDNSFSVPLGFINDKLSDIDVAITLGEWNKALSMIEELMEWKPDFSELHWRKLLVSLKCKSDIEILSKGKVLENNPSFQNTIRYADEIHKPIYALIKKAEDEIVNLLEKEIITQESVDKVSLGVKSKPNEFQNEIAKLEELVSKEIKALDEVEKKLREFIIDYDKSVSSFKQKLTEIANKIKTTSEQRELTTERKNDLENYLSQHKKLNDDELVKIKDEYDKSLPVFKKLQDEQTKISNTIQSYVSQIDQINEKIKDMVYQIEKISQEYDAAFNGLRNGDYHFAKLKIKLRFDEILCDTFKTVTI